MDYFEYELKTQDGRNDLVTFTRENFFWEFLPREVQQILLHPTFKSLTLQHPDAVETFNKLS